MSKCMTIDESIDQRDTCTEIAPKEIIEFILEEVLLSAVLISDKGCSRIGDFNITEDFCEQYGRLPYLKDFEQVNCTANPSATNQESNVSSGKSSDRAASLVTAKENLELIIDSFVKKEERSKPAGECTVISEEVLADNELQIQNGQSHIENNNRKSFPEAAAREYFDKTDVIRDEKIEIEYYNEGKLSRIYVPLSPSGAEDVEAPPGAEGGAKGGEDSAEGREAGACAEEAAGREGSAEDAEAPFKPFAAEELRQVFSEDSVDPNRPRACAFGEEDVKKIIKEIEEIGFSQGHVSSEDFDVGCRPEGQGDADLESRSLSRSKDSLEKILNADRPQQELYTDSTAAMKPCESADSGELRAEEEREVFSSEEPPDRGRPFEKSVSEQSVQYSPEKVLLPEGQQSANSLAESSSKNTLDSSSDACADFKSFTSNVEGEQHLQYRVADEESAARSKVYPDRAAQGSDQFLQPVFSAHFPPGWMPPQTEEDVDADPTKSCLSLTGSKERENENEEQEPPVWEAAGSLYGSTQEQLTEKNLEFPSERESKTFREDSSEMMKTSRSASEAQVCAAELSAPPQGSSISLVRLSASLSEDLGRPTNATSQHSTSPANGADGNLEDPDPTPDWLKTQFGLSQSSDGGYDTSEALKGKLGEPLASSENLASGFPGHEGSDRGLPEEDKVSRQGSSVTVEKPLSENESEKNLNWNNLSEPEDRAANLEVCNSSSTPSQAQISSHSLTNSDDGDDSDAPEAITHNFKLHSQKMYSGVNHEPDSRAQQKYVPTESEEAFIDEAESVLQVIEPQEHSGDEDSGKVFFSLLCEPSLGESSAPAERDSEAALPLEKTHSSETETAAKRVYSGMTTIGPMKNTDYDPKDLTAPNIDYGKMTRITSSRQLAKEIDLFGSELNAAASVKIVEDDSDNDLSVNIEDSDHMEFTSLVNRDIASLTKVQKVREVMSHQPKPEDDFEDEDTLPRPRLDLKDVESMTDERYKVPDVSIPLLSLEISDTNGTEKELMENMGLVLSSLTNPVYYEEDFEEHGPEAPRKNLDEDLVQAPEFSEERPVEKRRSEAATADGQEEGSVGRGGEEEREEGAADERSPQEGAADPQQESASGSPKYGTLGSVFRKASNRFIRRDGDLFLRNSKSLPRDTSKITATDSIRSILDDCQSSASSMLKKSKSLLKNTQSIFKSMSSSRVTSDPDSGHSMEKKKLSPSESDVSTLERKLSSFLRKEDFTKAKNLIKSKVEKLKNLDSGSSTAREKALSEKGDLRVAVRDEEKLRVDRIENFKKLLPKSQLVYKSQFVKSQMSMQNSSSEAMEAASNCAFATAEGEQNDAEENVTGPPAEDKTDRISVEEAALSEIPDTGSSEAKAPLQQQQQPQWLPDRDELRPKEEEPEPQQPEYIVMETIQGLPTTDLDSPSSDKENLGAKNREQVEREAGSEMKKTEASNSLQTCADGLNDVVPFFAELEEEKMGTKTPSERKIKTKKKKLTARLRSFWCSAFGKVKTSPKKGDHS